MENQNDMEKIDARIHWIKKDVNRRSKWRNAVHELIRNRRSIRSPSLTETKPDRKIDLSLSLSLSLSLMLFMNL